MKIKPTARKVAIELLDPDDDDDVQDQAGSEPMPHQEQEAVLVLINGVGSEVKGMKSGDMALAHPWVKHSGLKVDDTTRIVDSYDIAAVVTSK